MISAGSEEGSYGKPVLLLRAATCNQPSGLFSILQVQVKDPDWGLNILLTSKQNTKHKKLSLQLISKSSLGSKGPPTPAGRKRLLIPEAAESHWGPASGHRLYFCPPVTSERSDGAREGKPRYAQKWEERKLPLWFLLSWAEEGGSAWEPPVLGLCRARGSSRSRELAAGLGSGADLAAGSIFQMA